MHPTVHQQYVDQQPKSKKRKRDATDSAQEPVDVADSEILINSIMWQCHSLPLP